MSDDPRPQTAPATQPDPVQPGGPNPRGRWVAIVTGALSVLIGVLYLVLITVLDSRGPLLPPPPEALGIAVQAAAVPLAGQPAGAAAGDPGAAATAPPPA